MTEYELHAELEGPGKCKHDWYSLIPVRQVGEICQKCHMIARYPANAIVGRWTGYSEHFDHIQREFFYEIGR